MNAANVRQNEGDRKGFHIFRHRFITALLENGVPRPIISKVAGHVSPESIDVYLSADFKNLKECALSVEQFPIPKGVLGNVKQYIMQSPPPESRKSKANRGKDFT